MASGLNGYVSYPNHSAQLMRRLSLFFTSRLNSCLLSLLIIRQKRFVNFGIDRYFSTRLSYIARARQDSNHTTDSELPLPVVAIAHGTRRQWKNALQELGKVQKLVSAGSALLIPCVLNFNSLEYC